MLDFVLGLASLERRSKVAPKLEQALAGHFQYAADILGSILVQKPAGLLGIGVHCFRAISLPS